MKQLKSMFWALAVTAITLFASCSDDDIVAEVTLPTEIEQAQSQGLESHSYSIPFDVQSDTEWKIEFDEAGEEIAYVNPSSGKGNATIKLYVMDNLSKEPREGIMTIVFPEDTGKNKVVTLKQKAQGASDDNFSTDAVGNITYGVGYGFNVVTGVGPRALKNQIIKAGMLTDSKHIQKAPTSSSTIDFKTYSGSTIKDLSNDFSVSANISGGGYGIEAEANTKFNMNHYSKDEYQFAMSFVDVSKEQITITLHEDEWIYYDNEEYGCYTTAAYKAINGEYRQYSSTNAGFKALFDKYGTHVVRTATLGGRLTIATTVNTSEVKAEYELEAFAKLSYNGIIDTSVEVSENLKSSFNSSSSACQTKISVLGGSTNIFNDLNDLIGDGAKSAAQAWFDSLNEDESTWTFIGLDHADNLIPIWQLVEDPDRAKQMQEYFESGLYAKEVNQGISYDLGVQAQVTEMPEFDVHGTQIADIKLGSNQNKTVARVCNEFIPELDEKAPVKVFYPVVNGSVKWSMGWFPGNSYYPPRRVINADGKIKVEAISSENELGEASEIYIRGVHISSQSLDEEIPVQETTHAFYYDQLYRERSMSDYKVVKIQDRIWLAENFAGLLDKDGNELQSFDKPSPVEVDQEGYKDYYMYSGYFCELNNIFPGNWNHIYGKEGVNAKPLDNIVKMLEQYNIDVVKAFGDGGCLRFNAIKSGYIVGGHYASTDIHTPTNRFYIPIQCVTNDRSHMQCYFLDMETGSYGREWIKNRKHMKYVHPNMYYHSIFVPLRLHRPLE